MLQRKPGYRSFIWARGGSVDMLAKRRSSEAPKTSISSEFLYTY